MTKAIVNLSLPLVIQQTEAVLETYPHHPYQQAFSIPDVRQKLICYVLSRMPGLYTVVEETERQFVNPSSMCSTLGQRNCQIETLIRQGIQSILSENLDWIDRHIPEEAESRQMPSNWFG
jgi:hypothetical protein